jgi:hypothetical protein
MDEMIQNLPLTNIFTIGPLAGTPVAHPVCLVTNQQADFPLSQRL